MLSVIDWGVIGLYLAGTITVGILCRGRQESASDYFTAAGTMGSYFRSVLVGLSVAAAYFSGISFLAFPSLTYSGGIMMILKILLFPAVWYILHAWFLPRYLQGAPQPHPYAIIERRFGSSLRTLTAGMYILMRVGWMAVLICAPATAILGATGLGREWFWPIVLAIGLSSTLYTTIGGIRGVIVVDAIQFLIIMVGILATFLVILKRLPVSLGETVQFWRDSGKLALDVSLNPQKVVTVWSMTFGINISYLCSLLSDQMSLQRYLSTGRAASASRSIAYNMIGVVIVSVFLAGIGMFLAAWYHFNPDPNLPAKTDHIFPWFIGSMLPTGLSGLLLASLLAATMSSMNGGINILSAVITLDFLSRFVPGMTQKQQLWFARIASVIVGIGATLTAGLVERLGSIFDQTQTVMGLFLGPIFVVVLLAAASVRVHRASLAAGMILAVFTGLLLRSESFQWASVWICATTCLTTLAVTFLGTVIFQKSGRV